MSEIDRPERPQGGFDLQSTYAAKDSREAAEVYDSWAEDYERSVTSWGYTTPAIVAGLLGRYVRPEDGPVLDAGAGTGIAGEILTLLGYGGLVGIDVSRDMLELARTKGVYEELREMALGGPLDLPDNAFAATIAAGVFAAGHAPPESFDELIRTTKPGGCAVFSVRTDVYEDGGFREAQEAIEKHARWQRLEMTEPVAHLRFENPDLKVRVFAYRVS